MPEGAGERAPIAIGSRVIAAIAVAVVIRIPVTVTIATQREAGGQPADDGAGKPPAAPASAATPTATAPPTAAVPPSTVSAPAGLHHVGRCRRLHGGDVCRQRPCGGAEGAGRQGARGDAGRDCCFAKDTHTWSFPAGHRRR